MDLPKIEQKILKFWKEKNIFEKSLKKTEKGPRFVFYEGPPFANAKPGVHSLLARAFKDVILRYKTMQNFFVRRKAGWDTHGLPTEMETEKKLGIKNKKEIEKIGIEKFVEECRDSVFTYKKEWEDFSEKIGFWLDFENAYITCSNDYIETLWWILKQIWQKKLLYQDYKVVPYCPRCGTSLSTHEVAQGYQKIKEPAVYVKFQITNDKFQTKGKTHLLVWTTTPWTLPGNVAIAVNPEVTYSLVRVSQENLILAKDRLGVLEGNYEVVREFKGRELVDIKYQPLFDFARPDKKAHLVVTGDFVSVEEGTGLVHIAPAFGEEDLELGRENDLSIILNVDSEGKFREEVKPWAGRMVTDEKLNQEIIEELGRKNVLFSEEAYEHDYPFCWRCDSKLIYYAKNSWFIKMTTLKKELIENNRKINWIPEYIKEGRFGEWLKEVKDWNLTRERYWGTPLPVWKCQTGENQKSKSKKQKYCNNIKVIGSIEELTKLSSKKITDLHRPFIDEITFKCEKCGGVMKRVPEVIDCWFDSGSMPFGQWHYPFENKDLIDKGEFFPADFISEGIDQTRGWFYTLLAISTLLDKGPPYKNVICLGLVYDKYGKKMSKSRGNIVYPQEVTSKYGADVARFYFYTVNPEGEAKRFNLKEVEDLSRKFFDTLWQSFNFFSIYKGENFKPQNNFQAKNLLDRWIISRLENLNSKLIKNLDNYQVVSAARLFIPFVDDLSNWYIRRSRKRFQKPETKTEKEEASQTLCYTLLKLAKLLAPFTPFISEELYQRLGGKEESVHLENYPEPDKDLLAEELENKMSEVREIVASALAQRAKARIKVRQPLALLKIKNQKLKIKDEEELLDLIKEEVNVKKIIFDSKIKEEVELDTEITKELKEEGQVREFIRQIQQLRKIAKLTPKDKIVIYCDCQKELERVLEKNKKVILSETKAKELRIAKIGEEKLKPKELKIDNQKINLVIKKI